MAKKYKKEREVNDYEYAERNRFRRAIRKYRKLTGIDVEKYIENIEKQGVPE